MSESESENEPNATGRGDPVPAGNAPHHSAPATPAPAATPAPTATIPESHPGPTRLAPRILTIAIYTLLPIAGVLFFGWDWREVIILYWLENVALGVAMVIRMLRTIADPGTDALSIATIDWLGVFLVFAVGGLIQLAMAAFGPLGPKRGSALMMSAYPRIIVLHITIIGGAFLIASLGWPPIAALLLIGMHGAVDAVAIVRANRAHREPAPA